MCILGFEAENKIRYFRVPPHFAFLIMIEFSFFLCAVTYKEGHERAMNCRKRNAKIFWVLFFIVVVVDK